MEIDALFIRAEGELNDAYLFSNQKAQNEGTEKIDDLPLQYSPMSEDSDEARFCDDRTSTSSSQPESRPTCPVLPYRYQRPLTFQVQGKAMLTVKRECALSLWKKIIERKISLTLSS
ncbi:hypothetical protein Bca4012_003384 [Brassica carinata]